MNKSKKRKREIIFFSEKVKVWVDDWNSLGKRAGIMNWEGMEFVEILLGMEWINEIY